MDAIKAGVEKVKETVQSKKVDDKVDRKSVV